MSIHYEGDFGVASVGMTIRSVEVWVAKQNDSENIASASVLKYVSGDLGTLAVPSQDELRVATWIRRSGDRGAQPVLSRYDRRVVPGREF
jgi:hypothetical protein